MPLTGRVAMVAACALVIVGCSSAPGASPTDPPAATPSEPAATQSGTAPATPSASNITLETERAASATVGPGGGSLAATDAAGTAYRLTIPAGALGNDVEISVVPLSDIVGLPGELRVHGGVRLLPEGLSFLGLAELSVTLGRPPDGPLVPFAFRGDLEEPHRYPATIEGATVTFGIAHFSGYALLAATQAAITAAQIGLLLPWNPPTGPADQALASIAAVIDLPDSPERTQHINASMGQWLTTGLRPVVQQFRTQTTWDFSGPYTSKKNDVQGSFLLWNYASKLLILAGVAIDPALGPQVRSLAVSAATHGISISNTNCRASTTAILVALSRAGEPFDWVGWATSLGLAGADPALSETFVREHLCVKVIFDPNGGTDFSSGLQPGQTGTLALRAGIRIDGTESRFDSRFDVTITPRGANPNSVVQAQTGTDGRLSRQFAWDAAASELRLDIRVCLRPPLAAICQDAFVVRGTAAASTPPPGQCASWEITLDGQTTRGNDPSGMSLAGSKGSVTLITSPGVILTAFQGGTSKGKATVPLRIESIGASVTFSVTAVFYGRAQDDRGGQVTVKVTVNGTTKTYTSPNTGPSGGDVGPGVLEFPLTLRHGDIVKATIEAQGKAAQGSNFAGLTGTLFFLDKPSDMGVGLVTCP